MLKLMFITNDEKTALLAQRAGVDRIFVDLETYGKEKRQKGLDTVKSRHSIKDIQKLRSILSTSELLVRCNPIHHFSKHYSSNKDEINQIIAAGADIIMLPFFKNVHQVKKFLKLVGGRTRTMLLFETPESIKKISKILKMDGIDECYIGLNDLSLGYNMSFMFEPLSEGIVDNAVMVFKKNKKPFGFGGIASLGKGCVPSEFILKEHYRLGSSSAILSRSFCKRNANEGNEDYEKRFISELKEIRNFEQHCLSLSAYDFHENSIEFKKMVLTILKEKRNE